MKNQKTVIHVKKGNPLIPGVVPVSDGYNITLEAPEKSACSIILYHKGQDEPYTEIKLDDEKRVGRIRSVFLKGIDPTKDEYNFCVDGTVIHDPSAFSYSGKDQFGAPLGENPHQIRGLFAKTDGFDWQGDKALDLDYNDAVLYKLHVRGFTKTRNGVKAKGTFQGLEESIPYLLSLGINMVELMPICEFDEVSPASLPGNGMVTERVETGKINYWGYTSGNYYAPKRAYCATDDPENEVRSLVRALHKAGIECILEFYFPATVNPSYALLALKMWKLFYHIDGFHILGDGLRPEFVLHDGLLSETKLIFQSYALDGQSVGSAGRKKIAVCDLSFQNVMRKLLKSDEGMTADAVEHIRKNSPSVGIINYMTSQDGFTLNDLVSYNYRHNEENGENNRDGCDFNNSWNCGVEGPSRKLAIREMRARQIRNAFLLMLLSQGTPMIYAGDEFGNSQGGNNNAWCQDNPTGWLDWKGLKKNGDLLEFVKQAIAFRKEHPILHCKKELRGTDYLGTGLPDFSVHGERAWYMGYENACRKFGILYNEAYGRDAEKSSRSHQTDAEDFLYVLYNFNWEEQELALPDLLPGMKWHKICDTSAGFEKCFSEYPGTYSRMVKVAPRSIMVLAGRSEEKKGSDSPKEK